MPAAFDDMLIRIKTMALLILCCCIFCCSYAGSISSGRRWYLGREWDHVFDVEMDSGIKLKLACDDGENSYIVADRFLEQHELPQEFKEQVGSMCQ